MLTFFTTGKPFRGHDGIIQRNALKSWKMLHPDVEVIFFGDEEGAAEVCQEYGLRHEPMVERFNGKMPYINFMFARAQQVARHDYVCYCNCDIILFSDFLKAFQKARAWRKRFLLIGRRWDTDVPELIHFDQADWAGRLRDSALARGSQQDEYWIDFFLFPKGLYVDIPALIVGYCYWDNWMVWRASSLRVPVLDASAFAVTVHQNHPYSAESQRIKGVANDPLSLRNLELIGGKKHLLHIDAATHRFNSRGRIWSCGYRLYLHTASVLFRRARWFWPFATDFLLYKLWNPVWHWALGITRPARSVLGLRSKSARAMTKHNER
jgi:hypothetical protein